MDLDGGPTSDVGMLVKARSNGFIICDVRASHLKSFGADPLTFLGN